jgi:hypothetical protein
MDLPNQPSRESHVDESLRESDSRLGETRPRDGNDSGDFRIIEALRRLPLPAAPADLPGQVRRRIARRRMAMGGGGLAAAMALILLGWSFWRRGPGDDAIVGPNQETLVAQWDELLEEAASLPPAVVELRILETQQAWIATLENVHDR